ncbi:hypothetical protein [Dactylosporangium sp. NPDC048998]|uniref:hypothetical protein n=1 Tax=Dactylosporangium sp. NPDC048998 TaxID=3363976 RepID=UPI0037220CB6
MPHRERHDSGGGPWMSQTHSVIEDELADALPSTVAAQLFDLGLACNTASLAYRQALLTEERAGQALDAIREDDPAVMFRRFAATEQADAALDTAEQLLSTYAVLAATYAEYATTVLAAAAAGKLQDVEPVTLVATSALLTDPDSALPVVQLPPGTAGDGLTERLQQLRRRVTVAASNARASGVTACYDGRSAATARPDGGIELSEDVPDGLHAYAALLLESLGLLVAAPRA